MPSDSMTTDGDIAIAIASKENKKHEEYLNY